MSTLEITITLAILFLMAFGVWRTGQRNPVDTGTLQRDVSRLKADVAAIRHDIDVAPSAADVAGLRQEVKSLRSESVAATESLRREMALVIKASDATESAVVRMEQFLLANASTPGRRR
jgi:outer membrane murein-binding lipoprotein Lpp